MEHNFGLLLAKRGANNADVEALLDCGTGARYTFRELNARANRVASAMAARGIAPGDRVALLMTNGVEFVESFFGLAKTGAVIVPLNWRLVADELAFILKNSGARCLLYSTDFRDTVTELHAGGAAATDVTDWIEVRAEDAPQPFASAYQSLLAAGEEMEPPIRARDDDNLFIMYTSGTTGLPKGSVHTHESFLWSTLTMAVSAELRFKDRYAIALPLFHVGALLPLTSNVYRGVTNLIMREFDPVVMLKLIETERVTNTLAVPAMLNFMMQLPEFANTDFSSLRWIISGASPVPVTLIEQYEAHGIEIHQAYGLTESGGPACIISPDDAMQRIGSTGKAFFHTEVRIVDPDGNDVPPHTPGEVVVKARHLMKEYWNNPEATAETIRDGWLYTGDVALMDEDGFVTIHDRVKDMVISGGENVYPAEIENVILSHPAVADVAVFGQPSQRWGESPFAAVVKSPDAVVSEAEILKHCDGKMARFKMPKGVAFIDEVPRNPSGKALKRLLREQFPGPAAE